MNSLCRGTGSSVFARIALRAGRTGRRAVAVVAAGTGCDDDRQRVHKAPRVEENESFTTQSVEVEP